MLDGELRLGARWEAGDRKGAGARNVNILTQQALRNLSLPRVRLYTLKAPSGGDLGRDQRRDRGRTFGMGVDSRTGLIQRWRERSYTIPLQFKVRKSICSFNLTSRLP